MSRKFPYAAGFVTLSLMLPAAADTFYSGLQNIPIPIDFAGVFLDVDGNTTANNAFAGWDINPFFGGADVANSSAFQPARTGTDALDPIWNFSQGNTVGSGLGLNFASQYGGSETHLGSGTGQFAPGTDGYIGFSLNGNYGWMRVAFTENTSGAVIRDWAYATSGAAIVVGSSQTNVTGADTTMLSLTPRVAESFTLGSVIANNGSTINSVNQTGNGTTVLTGVNTYTGDTTVTNGRLLVNGTNIGTGATTVAIGATFGGTGSIAGTLSVSGVLSPGASVASFVSGALTMTSGSTFVFEATDNSPTGADLMVVNGALSLTDVTLDLVNANLGLNTWLVNDKITLISYTGSPITSGFTGYTDDAIYTIGLNQWRLNYNDTLHGNNFAGDIPLDTTTYVTFTVVPETRAALLGGIGLLILLRRRR